MTRLHTFGRLLLLGWILWASELFSAQQIHSLAPHIDEVDLALVLAADVSSSMDAGELKLQREGYVSAFRDPDVVEALFSGFYRRVAVTYLEWAGANCQMVIAPWTVLDNYDSADEFALKLSSAPMFAGGGQTSISNALRFAVGQFAVSGVHSPRRTIDISGDGPNDDGPPLEPVRSQIIQRGVTINGLSIALSSEPELGPHRNVLPAPERFDLKTYYESAVAGGPGSFEVAANSMRNFATAIRRKLVIEIAAQPSGATLVELSASGNQPLH